MRDGVRKSWLLVTLMLFGTLIVLPAEEVDAAEIVITDAVQVVDGGPINERMATMVADSEGNVHIVWSRNTQHLYYTMLDPRAEVLIDVTQISNPGQHRAWHPATAIDSEDRIHVTWVDKANQHAIKYTVIDPAEDDMDGSSADDATISLVDDFTVSQRNQNRDWPAIDVDSEDNAHIVWEDAYDPLDKFYQQPQIYYSMIQIDFQTRDAITAIDDSMLTPIIGHKGHPDVAVDADDFVQVVWDDTRGGKVEMVVPIDTSGSMYSEWADVCTVFYGGSFSGGTSFRGLKPMLEDANITVYETIYAILGYGIPSAGQSGDCATAYSTGGSGSQGPRATHLGQNPSDNSGGIRKLQNFVFNGGSITGNSGEDWGPAANWACLSWVDAQGNMGSAANPPTGADHRWNPNATKIVIPISDEGPRNGHPAQQADDTASINEAHDSCVNSGVVPVPMEGSSWGGGGTDVQSHMLDLAQCPNGVVNSNSRICPGSTTRNTDAGGHVYQFPASGSSAQQMQLLVEAMVYLATNNSREIYLSVLDPYALLDRPSPGWSLGDPATSSNSGRYTEDLGPSMDSQGYGHLVVVNDTRVTLDDAFSMHPSVAVDTKGNTHVAWMDGRGYGFEKEVNYEVYYTRLRLRGVADWNGVPGGLPTFGIKQIVDTNISYKEGPNNIPQGNYYQPSSYMPEILTDSRDNVHIVWLDNSNTSQGETIMYTRLNHTNDDFPAGDGIPLNSIASSVIDGWQVTPVTTWSSNKLGPNTGRAPELSQPPAFSNDLGSGAHIAWSDTNKCNDEGNSNTYTLCYVHVLTGQVDVILDEGETYYHEIEPGEQTIYNITVNNTTPGPADLVADTFSLNLSGVPLNWTATAFFSENHTAIFSETPVFLRGGEMVRIYLRIRAPSIYQADQDELAAIVLSAVSHKDPAIRSDLLTLTLMDVKHLIQLDTSHYQSDVEQGQTAIFSITITNNGNVYDTFQFYDPTSVAGQREWLLPFGWGIQFPLSVSLDPGQSVTKNLEVSIPTTQEPGTFVLYVKGWSTGDSGSHSVEEGTLDILELWVNVSIRSTGNIVFEIFDTSEYVLPGDCAEYTIDVIKHFAPGYLIFSTPGGPDERPEEIPEHIWRQDNWVIDLDFKNAPGGNEIAEDDPRHWDIIDKAYEVEVQVCAPTNASAGLGPAVTIKAHLQGASRVSDSVILSTNVKHVYDLDAAVPEDEATLDPGERWILPVTVENLGNGPDRYDMRVGSITDSDGFAQPWIIDIPRGTLIELQRGDMQMVEVLVEVPERVAAGEYTVEIDIFSEEAFGGTRLRDTITLDITVNEFHDMRFELDPYVESPVKTTAPGRTVRFILNVTNNGNVPDTATVHNHTKKGDVWDENPGMNTLSNWNIRWALVEDFNTEFPSERECVVLKPGDLAPEHGCWVAADGTWTFPRMAAYETIQVAAIIEIAPDATLANREIGVKLISEFGGQSDGGDADETGPWADSCTIDNDGDGFADNVMPCDTNEQILSIRLRAPDLIILEALVSEDRLQASVGDMIPVNVKIINDGNVHATDIHIILCVDQDEKDIRRNGCAEENVVYRQVIGALMPPGEGGVSEDEVPVITLLYPVTAGSHKVTVVVDPDNNIVEKSEDNNYQDLTNDLSSQNGVIDVAVEVMAQWSVPTIIIGATIGLIGVATLVMISRRKEALDRVAEQSSLMGNDDEMRF